MGSQGPCTDLTAWSHDRSTDVAHLESLLGNVDKFIDARIRF